MTPSPRAGPTERPVTTWLLAAAVACVALFAVLRGQTTAWDLRNYHLYAPWALLHGRAAIDLAPAQLQTWFNPLLSVPYFLASTMLPAWACTFLLGLVQGTNVLVLHAIARRVFPSSASGLARFALPVAVAVGFLSATSVSEIGTTYGDNLVSIPCLASLALLLRAFAADGGTRADLAGAGLLAGIAVGLKLVVAPFALGLVAVAAFLPGRFGTRMRTLIVFGIALLVGVALAGGWNFWRNWLEFGNPVYPQFGHLFGGRWDPPFAVSDLRWQVHGIGEAFGRPLDLISHWEAAGELRFRDARLPLMLFTALAWPWCRRRIVDPRVRLMLDALCAGFLVAWCAWLVVFGYHRYLCGWEMLAPIVAIAFRLIPYGPLYDSLPFVTAISLGLQSLVKSKIKRLKVPCEKEAIKEYADAAAELVAAPGEKAIGWVAKELLPEGLTKALSKHLSEEAVEELSEKIPEAIASHIVRVSPLVPGGDWLNALLNPFDPTGTNQGYVAEQSTAALGALGLE